jgi:hypothetical protein
MQQQQALAAVDAAAVAVAAAAAPVRARQPTLRRRPGSRQLRLRAKLLQRRRSTFSRSSWMRSEASSDSAAEVAADEVAAVRECRSFLAAAAAVAGVRWYTVRLTVGDKTYTSAVQVLEDIWQRVQ